MNMDKTRTQMRMKEQQLMMRVKQCVKSAMRMNQMLHSSLVGIILLAFTVLKDATHAQFAGLPSMM